MPQSPMNPTKVFKISEDQLQATIEWLNYNGPLCVLKQVETNSEVKKKESPGY